MANLDLSAVQTDLCNGCTAHSGFWRSWVDARKGVLAAVKIASNSHPDYELVATGHSLGGAIATLAAAQLRNDGYNTTLYTFGAPRVASATLSSYITKQAGGNYRITHWNDPVPRLPPLWMNYVHISPEYYINRPTFALVSATDLKTYTGSVNLLGNAAWIVTDVGAHLWYMLSICGCSVTNVLTGRDPQKHAEIVAKF
ncbi:alpha/beta-hydrolase [Polyplosphaeria fusca]|uniref:Alpha/beta-hydrolase n=1 Tax=Polyplosphaeria fusca TaxID=682080 RepID=A0A9P4R7W1_9PLEO|nr:alpha/beta-hydrolase [Polyplosphaeria fusca]